MNTKRCFKCGEEKLLSEYYLHPRMADGHLNKCKACARKDASAHRAENPGAVLATRLRMAEKNPSKRNANRCVEAAIDAGEMSAPSECSGCGAEARLSAHHHDYTKPLDVVWVCPKCHSALDAIRREREGKKPNYNSRGVVMLVDGREACSFDTISAAARAIGRASSSLRSCLNGRTKTCGGMEWRYA